MRLFAADWLTGWTDPQWISERALAARLTIRTFECRVAKSLLISDDVRVTGELRVLSVYEGFFTGGARILHSGVIAALHGRASQTHSVLSIHSEMRRESLRQRMRDDASFRLLRAAGLEVCTLGRTPDRTEGFTPSELALATRHLAEADIVVSLKEQPLRLITAPGLPRRPIVVCLHRSDPENQGQALADLKAAVAAGRIAACICCAEATRAAYAAAGIPMELLHVVANGADVRRFRSAGTWARACLRRMLGLPGSAAVVAFAARHDGMKNVPLFLLSAREFLRRHPTAHVVMRTWHEPRQPVAASADPRCIWIRPRVVDPTASARGAPRCREHLPGG